MTTMKIGSNEILKAACIQAAATAVSANPKGSIVDINEIIAKAESLYLKWMDVERRQHTQDLRF
jgi:hypothetical protein